MPPLDHLEGELQQLERAHLLRVPRELPEGTLVLCSNDYLGYAAQPLPLSAEQLATLPSGSGASRLISGSHASHRDLEATLADWVGHESALGFSAGFAANIGVIAALAGDGDAIISDALNHASIIDGCRLSRARVLVAKHDDLGSVTRALEDSGAARRRYVITETYFSMDGRTPDLAGLRAVCDEHDAVLVVDEAHALGVFGARGAGLCRAHGVVPDVLIGTLGKAVGLQGAFVAGSRALIRLLYNRARSFVFSTAIAPWLARAAVKRVKQVADDDAARVRLEAMGDHVRTELRRAGAPLASSHGPIIPWICGESERAVALSETLLGHGVFVQAIRPPTVPSGSARLRLSLSAALSDADVDRALCALKAIS